MVITLGLITALTLTSTSARGQGTAIIYQGRLSVRGAPATGSYDLQFGLFTTNEFGTPAAPVLTSTNVSVNDGLFSTTLDFGSGVFSGQQFWIEVGVRTNANGTFTTLSPRQPITPAPYAITAENAIRMTGLTVLSNTNGGPNLVGGSPNNFVSSGVVGATVGGGGAVEYNGAHYTNSVRASFATVGGGAGNSARTYGATVSGGIGNLASAALGTIGGGQGNAVNDSVSTVSGGENNAASINDATVGGGDSNVARGAYATVGGGSGNTASGFAATASGGSANTASGDDSTVVGGNGNTASGDYSFAAGNLAHAGHNGSFVWADYSPPFSFSSSTANQFRVRATGGVAFVSAIDNSGNVTSGVHLLPGDTAWSGISDKNSKKNLQPVNGETVLEKLTTIPVERWNYKWESDASVPHIGPMAQDFKAAFYPGRDDKSISTLEFDGVELAAIQGLNQKLETRLKEKDAEIENLKLRLEKLERFLNAQTGADR